MQYTYQGIYFTAQKFLNSFILMSFSVSAVFFVMFLFVCFSFTCFTSAKHFPLSNFFIWGNKNSCSGQDWVNREGGA